MQIQPVTKEIVIPQDLNINIPVAAKERQTVEKSSKSNLNNDIFNIKVKNILDSIINTDNNNSNHPLSAAKFKPIDFFEDAIKELEYFQTKDFADKAVHLFNQPNTENILSLFLE